MFARAGNDGGDDPYNFDIVGGYGGGSKKSKKSKLGGKAPLNKTVGASPITSSLTPQESPAPNVRLGATATSAVLKDPLRASAPAGPTSALDKAMSYLNKYKQGGSSAAIAKGANTLKKPPGVAKTTFDEDEMDMSWSSDSDAAGRTPGRKATSRLKASRDEPGLAPTATSGTEKGFASRSLALSGMRSSGRFGTAKELGISESGGLDGPKAAVSPVGIHNNRFTKNSSEGGARYQADARSPSEHQSSSLRLVVNMPGESSTYGSPINHGSESDIESVGSAVAEALEEQFHAVKEVSEAEPWLGSLNSELGASSEVDAGGSSGLVSPTLGQRSGPNSKGLARSPPDRSALGKVMSIDDLATVSRPQTSPNPRDRGTNAADESGSESSERIRGSYAAEGAEPEDDDGDDDEEDDYGDDAFEDQDVLMESIGEPAPTTEGHNTSSAHTTEAPSHESRVGQSALPAAGTASDQGREVVSRPFEAWSMPPVDKEETRPLPGNSDSGTSPRSCVHSDTDKTDEQAPPGTREAWVERSARGSCATKDESVASAATGGVARPSFPNTEPCHPQCGNSARGTGKEETRRGSLSKRGVLIDRSTEASNPIRPSDTEMKVIARVEAVASVEYAHDPESGLNLRSCGTQMVGNSAAVQANILVPGMAGTHTSVNILRTTSSTHAPGVGYQNGEPYAKWGRFACDMPASCSLGRDPYARGGLWEHPSRSSPRRHPRSWEDNEPDANVGQEDDDGNGGDNTSGNVGDGGAAHLDDGEEAGERFGGRDATRAPTTPFVRRGPAYLETFLDVMEKSQAETCYTWQQVLETADPRRMPASPDGRGRREGKMGTADVVDDTEPCNRDGPTKKGQERDQGSSEADVALHSIMAATQDSFKRQLADMRENLNKIRYRAEVTGRQAYGHNYEAVSDVRDYLARARPPPTRPAKALMTVDPSLTREEAETLADGGTVPPSPVER